MGYNYAALIAAWNTSSASAGALPSGVAGTSLFGLTTAQKLAALNAWTVTGSSPTTFYLTGVEISNCINYAEFAALTATQQLNLLTMLNQPGGMIGGSAQTAQLMNGMMLAYFSHTGPTITALTALADGIVQPWWQYAGYNGSMSTTDTTLAGVS